MFKARIVACGNEQVHGLNFQETFAPTSVIFSGSVRRVSAQNNLDVPALKEKNRRK